MRKSATLQAGQRTLQAAATEGVIGFGQGVAQEEVRTETGLQSENNIQRAVNQGGISAATAGLINFIPQIVQSTKANRAFSIWPELETVTAPIAICVAESDALHAHDDALKIAEILPNGEVVEVPSNQFAHEEDVIPIIEDWILSVK